MKVNIPYILTTMRHLTGTENPFLNYDRFLDLMSGEIDLPRSFVEKLSNVELWPSFNTHFLNVMEHWERDGMLNLYNRMMEEKIDFVEKELKTGSEPEELFEFHDHIERLQNETGVSYDTAVKFYHVSNDYLQRTLRGMWIKDIPQ